MSAPPSPPRRGPGGPQDFLAGGGEAGELLRSAIDWEKTPLGPPADWPKSLKTAVRIMLTSRQPIWIGWGPELTYLYNDPYKSIIGGKHPWALGKPTSEVWKEIWADIGPMLDTALSGVEGTYVEEQLLVMERHGYPEETYYTFSYSPVPDDDGSVGGIICANTDDTARVIGERQLALLRELAARTTDARTWADVCSRGTDALATNPKDVPFALVYVADPGTGVFTLASATGIPRGHGAALESVPVDAPAVWPLAEAARSPGPLVVDLPSGGSEFPSGAWPRPPKAAALLPIPASGDTGRGGVLVVGLNPFRLFDDAYRGFLSLAAGQFAASIASAEAFAAERARAEQLAELDRAKTAFFSNVSHEFRTPLTLMLGPLEDILGPDSQMLPENRDLLTTVHRNGQRLLKLVNSLLDFSRIEAGRVQASYEPTDLATYTAELASVFRSAVERAGLSLVIDCPPLPDPVYVDRDMWEKVVLNLLSNAFKFTLEGEIRVRLAADVGRAVLSVTDTGTGIPAHELPNLFNRFHRVEGAKGRTHEGSGIGLALVQELVKLHGGEVTAESVYGKGSTFTVAVPLGRAHLAPDRIAGPRTQASTAVGAAPFVEEALRWLPGGSGEALAGGPAEARGDAPLLPARPRVLLADDNADMRDYVERLLAPQYDVITARDGVEALRRARERLPDLVVTDVMMPNLDGFGLLKALRADPQTATLPVIMLSARAGEEARVEGLEAGADDYLVKPFSARELLAKVGVTLALAKARRSAARREEELKAETLGVLESITDGFVALDCDWRFTYVNAAAERIIGMGRGELLGQNQWELFPATVGTVNEAGYRKAMAERVPVHFENFYPPFDRWFEVDVYPVPDAGIGVYFRDVTERKRAAEANARFRAVFEQATAGIAQTDLTGRFTLVNPRYCELLGYAEAELLALRMQDVTHPDDLPRNLGHFKRLAAGGPGFVIEKRYVRKDGSHVWVSNSVTAVRDASGAPTGVVAVSFDLTDRMRAEAALRQSEERLTLAQRSASVGTWDWDLVTGELAWSEGLYLLLDLEPFKLTPTADLWRELLHPDDLAEVGRLVEEAIRTGGDFYAEFRARRTDGSYVWVASKGKAYLAADGTPARFLGVNYDITQRKRAEEELKESEERFRRAIGIGTVGVLFFRLDGRMTGANAAFERMSGYSREELLASAHWRTLTPAEHYEVTARAATELAERGETAPYEKEMVRKDGSRWWGLFAPTRLAGTGLESECVEFVIDITQAKKAEEAIRERDERLQLFLGAATDYALIISDTDDRVLEWLGGAEQITGWRADEVLGQPAGLIFTRDDVAAGVPEAETSKAAETGRAENTRWHRRKDGSRFYAEGVTVALRGPGGDLRGFGKVFRDATEKKRTEERLTRDAVILANVHDAVIMTDPSGVVTYWNEGATSVFGWTADEVVGRPYADRFPEPVRAWIADEIRKRTEGDEWTGEYEDYRKDGSRVWIDARVTPVRDASGKVVGVLGVSHDITERKRAEERLKRMVNVDGVGVLVFALPEGRLVGANDFFLRMFGYTRDEIEAGRLTWRDMTPPEYVADSEAQMAGFAVSGRIGPYEKEYYRKDGSRAWLVFAGASLGDDTVVEYCIDVSDRKRAEAALREADRQKDDFIALLAHELRNPLAPIRNGLQVLRLSPDRDARERAQAMMDRQLTHMVRLIDDLLDVSRIGRNKMELRLARILLSDAVSNAVETARPLIEAAGHEFTVELPPDPVFLDADLTRLAQVFGNLLTNSAKYTERGGRITLTARRDAGDVVVTVADTGIGIPAEALPRIFDMFSQVDRSIERTTGGLGIGLALVKGLVEMHGGTVAATSGGVGQGAEFTVRLPTARVYAARPEQVPPGQAGTANGPGRRVLVVDDNRDSAESMGEMLRLFGHDVRTAQDGLEAVKLAAEFRPRVILMDVGMPKMNGYDATRIIRGEPWGKDIAIVALTGWGQENDRARSKEAGCDGHLVKPVSLADLQSLLGELV